MKLAIIGSRSTSAESYPQLVREIDALVLAEGEAVSVIISGGAVGADTLLAERYARERGIPIRIFLPDYAAHGRRAPLLRNQLIVGEASVVLAFWDGRSPGTAHALRMARRIGVKTILVVPQPA